MNSLIWTLLQSEISLLTSKLASLPIMQQEAEQQHNIIMKLKADNQCTLCKLDVTRTRFTTVPSIALQSQLKAKTQDLTELQQAYAALLDLLVNNLF